MFATLAYVAFAASTFSVAQGAACECVFAGTTLPMDFADATGNPLYGTYCMNWDSLPGTLYYKNDTECPPSKACEQGCNFMEMKWCYVEPGCTGATHTNTTIAGVSGYAYSYDICGDPSCWYPTWDSGCPGSSKCDNTCRCKYEGTTLPTAAANASGNPLYGTSCDMAWDSMPGTKYYKNETECPQSAKCTKECNYMNLEWCYVDPGCMGATSTSTTLEGAGAFFYSYDVCGNPSCWGDFGTGCPGGKGCEGMMTCQQAKDLYKNGNCCGNPSSMVTMLN